VNGTSSYRANVQGATMLSESLAEYSSLKVLEHQYGKSQMRKNFLDRYLMEVESKKKKPLMYNENQQYIYERDLFFSKVIFIGKN
jgi:ABC-2 type transport system permease protein